MDPGGPSGARTVARVGPTLPLGRWGELVVLDPDGDVPGELSAAAFMWRSEPRRFPALVRGISRGREVPYIAVLAQDADPFDLLAISVADLDGMLLASPREHRCFACGSHVAVLYPDHGLPTPGDSRGRHTAASGCPVCGALVGASRLTGLAIYRR